MLDWPRTVNQLPKKASDRFVLGH